MRWRLCLFVGLVLLETSASLAATRWIFEKKMVWGSFRNPDPTAIIGGFAITNSSILIDFRDESTHRQFMQITGERYANSVPLQQRASENHYAYMWYDEQSYSGLGRNLADWTEIFMQIHAMDSLTQEAMREVDRLTGTSLPRQGVMHELLEGWDLVEEDEARPPVMLVTGSNMLS